MGFAAQPKGFGTAAEQYDRQRIRLNRKNHKLFRNTGPGKDGAIVPAGGNF
jgi:hypothetical protein